jgi:hypothetical protein
VVLADDPYQHFRTRTPLALGWKITLLDSLNTVPWDSLRHAYGVASDVPGLLRALLSRDGHIRAEAFGELFSNIYHQGTVYEATAYAVPFLLEILRAPEIEDREDVLSLFAAIAAGVGYFEVHAREEADAVTWRSTLAKRGTTLDAELERERANLAAVRAAVEPGIELLVPLLTTAHLDTRLDIASALGRYPLRANETLPALKAALQVESDEDVREAIKDSIACLQGAG